MGRRAVQPVRGTRDFYPERQAFRNWLHETVRAVSRRFGYVEYEGPLLEPLELYAAKSGAELARDQAFTLTDKGGEALVLRPELTPSLARMVAQRRQELARPIRWFSFGPFWRYERPQKGRGREFFQWNADCLGSDSLVCEAELVALAVAFFREVGLGSDAVTIGVNDRRHVEAALAALGVAPERRTALFRLVDKRDAMPPEKWRAVAGEAGFAEALPRLEAFLADDASWKRSEALVRFFDHAEAFGIRDFLHYDPAVVRGLDYYTGVVFEARDASGALRALLGGGRYDNLVADVAGGSEPLSGAGFAMGDMVIEHLLDLHSRRPSLARGSARVLVTVFPEPGEAGQRRLAVAIRAAARLRPAGVPCALYPEPARLDKQLKHADSTGIPFAAIVGPEEEKTGAVSIKNLAERSQKTVDWGEAIRILRS